MRFFTKNPVNFLGSRKKISSFLVLGSALFNMGDLQAFLPHQNGFLADYNPLNFPLAPSLNPLHPEINEESWMLAERATKRVIESIQATMVSEKRRQEVVEYVQNLIKYNLNCEDLQTGTKTGQGYEQGDMYYLDDGCTYASLATATSDSPSLWHQRLGHPSLSNLRLLLPSASTISKLECLLKRINLKTKMTSPL